VLELLSIFVNIPLPVFSLVLVMAVTIGGILVSMVIARLLGAGRQMMAANVLIAAFGNLGNFGLPVSQFRLGDEALLAAAALRSPCPGRFGGAPAGRAGAGASASARFCDDGGALFDPGQCGDPDGRFGICVGGASCEGRHNPNPARKRGRGERHCDLALAVGWQ
jgi:hypothetical protein